MIINTIALVISSVTSILLVIKYKNYISQKLKIIDLPDEKRKIHKTPTSLIGGIIILINLIIINIYLASVDLINLKSLSVIFFCLISFFVGLIDDIKKISSINKLIIIGLAYFIIGLFNDNFFINYLYFETFSKFISLEVYSIFFSVLCLLLLINAFNLIDGINGLGIIISIIWMSYIFIYYNDINFSFLILIMTLIIILPFNLNGSFFLGDSGSILIGSIIGSFFITHYNQEQWIFNSKPVEEIFILFMVPGIDMFRLFVERILKRKNPFSSDSNHLHHYLIRKFSLKITLTIYTFMILLPLVIYNLKILPSYLIICLSLLIYLIILFYFKKSISYKDQ